MAQLDQLATRIKQPPMTDDINVLRSYIKDLANIVAMLSKNLEYIVNGNLDANNIRANSIEAKNIKAGAITAEKIDVDKLSAISADMGTIEAGEIYGSYIATTHTGDYPRIEFSSTANLLEAQGDSDSSVGIQADFSGSPSVIFKDAGELAQMFMISGILGLVSFGGADISISSSGSLGLFAGSGQRVEVDSWSELYSLFNAQTLQQALDALSARITALGG